MTNYIVSDTSLGSVADKIREKGGTSAPLEYPQGFIDAINAISGGGGEPVPDDGKTRIWIHIPEDTPDSMLTFYLRFSASEVNNTSVDWGDSVSETLGDTSAHDYPHKYAIDGDYVITITINSGTISFDGTYTSDNVGYSIYGERNTSTLYQATRIMRVVIGNNVREIGDSAFINCNRLKKLEIKNGVTIIGGHAFEYCSSLKEVILPNTLVDMEQNAFRSCVSLENVTIPNGITNIKANMFHICRSLHDIIIPSSVQTISDNAFSTLYSAYKIVVPASVTSIGKSFQYNYAMKEYHFKSSIPPTLTSSSTFTNIPSDCIIYVPQGNLSAYQTATTWSTYASQMQEEPT